MSMIRHVIVHFRTPNISPSRSVLARFSPRAHPSGYVMGPLTRTQREART